MDDFVEKIRIKIIIHWIQITIACERTRNKVVKGVQVTKHEF